MKRNIAAFGGDPDNLTIGGQSAGGISVMCQLTSPQNEGLCQRAIIQSGVLKQLYPGIPMAKFWLPLVEAEREGEKFFEFLGVSSLAEARKLDAVYLRDKAVEYQGFWGIVEDRLFNVGNPFDLFLQNKRLMVPVMTGHTSSEFFTGPNVDTMEDFKQLAVDMFGEEADEFLALCGADTSSCSLEAAKKNAYVNGIEYAIRVLGQANAVTGAGTPFYYYNFDADIPGWDNPGTFHSVDLWFFFETLAKCWRPFVGKHYDLARQMCDYWVNFIRNGDPNGRDSIGEDLPRWESYTTDAPYGMLFAEQAEFREEQPSEIMKFLVNHDFKKNRVAPQ